VACKPAPVAALLEEATDTAVPSHCCCQWQVDPWCVWRNGQPAGCLYVAPSLVEAC